MDYQLRFFSELEFKRACPACSLSDMDRDFMVRLDYARGLAGVPFRINSAFRSVEYEISKGRSGSSSHCKGLAVDLACRNSSERIAILSALVKCGFRRIGIHHHFIHVDLDLDKTNALWLY